MHCSHLIHQEINEEQMPMHFDPVHSTPGCSNKEMLNADTNRVHPIGVIPPAMRNRKTIAGTLQGYRRGDANTEASAMDLMGVFCDSPTAFLHSGDPLQVTTRIGNFFDLENLNSFGAWRWPCDLRISKSPLEKKR